jgi:hypothetical protein
VRATEEDLHALERSIEAMRELVDAGEALTREDRFLQLDTRFHITLARAAGNTTIEALMRMLFRELAIARDMAMHLPLVPGWTIDIHERTLAAVRSGDLDAVAIVMDEHVGQLERTWEEETARALVRPLPDFLIPGGPAAGGSTGCAGPSRVSWRWPRRRAGRLPRGRSAPPRWRTARSTASRARGASSRR